MNEFSDWFQNNWIDLARLLVQCAILAAVLRFGRKLLATLRASQEQVGALLKLSVTDAVAERGDAVAEPATQFEPATEAARQFHAELQPARRFEPAREAERRYESLAGTAVAEPEPEPVFAGAASRSGYVAEREQSLGGRVAGTSPAFSPSAQPAESPSLTPWVSAPAREPERLHPEPAPNPLRSGVSAWLQTPIRRSSVSPWRKVVRWLQAPAGH